MARRPIDQTRVEQFLATSSTATLAAFLDLPLNKLTYLLYGVRKEQRYREFSIRKRSGEGRVIRAPVKPLKQLQRALADVLVEIHKPRNCVYGYVRERGIRENAALHKNQRWILRVDLKDFFPSINFGRVRGIFLARPFSFQPDVATALAQLTTIGNELPQGAPTSPVISNLICHRLDRILSEIASKYRCFYSRYADDLVFSTARRQFPLSLAYLEQSQDATLTRIGDELKAAILKEGFIENERKLALRGRNSRQLCTGLVVNQRPNVKRDYVRQIRTMLYTWGKFGLEGAGRTFFERFDTRNRVTPPRPEGFRYVVRGRIQFLGSVKGWDDRVYMQLATRLSSLDPSFNAPRIASARARVTVWAEGASDHKHLRAALSYFQSKNEYTQIELEVSQSNNTRGSGELLAMCRSYAETAQRQACVFVFDRDEPKVVPDVTETGKNFKTWGNRVYSFSIPAPSHRADNPEVCIEMYYKDGELTRSDTSGRRIFLRNEFDDGGVHLSRKFVYRTPKRTAFIVDSDVVDIKTSKNVALPKSDFAKYVGDQVRPFDAMDFEAFRAIFEVIAEIAFEDAKLAVLPV